MQGLPPQQYTLVVNDRIVYVHAPYFPETEIATVTLETQLARVYDRPAAIEMPKQRVLAAPGRAIAAESIPTLIPEVLPPEESSDTEEPDEYDLFH